jgi:hypothetical protein
MKLRHLPVLLGLMMASPLFAQVNYNESIDGDLSDSGPAPTSLGVFGLGVNTIQGSLGPDTGGSGASNGSSDADIFTFNIAAGQFVESVTTTRSGPETQSFVGQANSNSIASFDSGTSLGAAIETGSLFTNDGGLVAAQAGGIPVTFGAGDQTLIFQETGPGPVSYSISFNVVSAVPEPSSVALLGGLAMVGFIRRRRK